MFRFVSLWQLELNYDRIKTTDAAKLQDEYAKLVEGLQESLTDASDTDTFMGNPGWMISRTEKKFLTNTVASTSR